MKKQKNLKEQPLTQEDLMKVVGGEDPGVNISGGSSNSGRGYDCAQLPKI